MCVHADSGQLPGHAGRLSRIARRGGGWYGEGLAVKTEKDLPVAKRNAYLKSMSALEMGNHNLVVSLLVPLVAEEPEFIAGRRLLREAQIMR